ncbi:MAG: hypothetical protein ABEJ57_05575 [Halobacteriaceae archaeon]
MSASDRPTPDAGGGHAPVDGTDVMAALDQENLVIADLSREDAWLTIPATDAPDLTDWR